MKKLTPQILAMYLGCQMLHKASREWTLNSVEFFSKSICLDEDKTGRQEWVELDKAEYLPRPILRKLEDMTEEEAIELNWRYSAPITFLPEEFAHLLPKSFDLFGLIEAGMAVDAKTLKDA